MIFTPFLGQIALNLLPPTPPVGAGGWVQRGTVITPADGASADNFGIGVALSADGTILVVGASQWEGTLGNQGGVYTYDWNGSSWVQRGSVLVPGDPGGSDLFGTDVALNSDGTVLAVGAPLWDSGADQGAAYVFDWNGSSWVQRSRITAPDAAGFDHFGISTALSADGTVLSVGAQWWENVGANRGGVYVFDWSGSAWNQRGSVLEAADAADGDLFGQSVSFSADAGLLAVGASEWESAVNAQGGVYLYDASGSSWTQRGSVLTSDAPSALARFGHGVALSDSGAVLVVGTPYDDLPGVADAGSVRTYAIDGTTFTLVDTLTPTDAAASNFFGARVALNAAASVMAVGATGKGTAGAVYIFDWVPD
jgi:hypothetical protein